MEDPELRYTDVVYAEDLLDQLIAVYPQVDQGRIYCTGHSMGCMMTHYLGSAEVSHRFAAMGATSGPPDGQGGDGIPDRAHVHDHGPVRHVEL